MADRSDVCVLVPTLDESETIADIVTEFRDAGFEHVFVMDGGSTDGTRRLAEEAGARVETQSGSGKGQAVREALEEITADESFEYVLMLDGDGTYRVADAEAMLAPLFEGRAEHVIGDRFHDMEAGAMPLLNRVGNHLINWGFARIHGRNLRDILSGYRAFTTDAAERMFLTAEGFGIETEMAVECVKHGIPTDVVGVTYRERPAGSDPNLRPFQDGAIILATMYGRAKTNNPLFYFGSVGLLSSLFGAGVGAYVGVEWVTRRVSHEVLAVVAAFGILFGFQLLMFGVLSDLIVTLHREQIRRFEDD